MGLTDYGLSKIMKATQNQSIVENFLKRVAWFKVWLFKKFPFTLDLLKINCFPNLKRFDECWGKIRLSKRTFFSHNLFQVTIKTKTS